MAQTILEKIKAYKLVEISEKKKVNPASRLKERITDKCASLAERFGKSETGISGKL